MLSGPTERRLILSPTLAMDVGIYRALRNADLKFAIKNSKLSELCKEQEIQAKIVSDFNEMVASLKKEMLERDSWQGENE